MQPSPTRGPGEIRVQANVPEDILVVIDAILIQEVFHNIVENAFKAIESEGVLTIDASMKPGEGYTRIVCGDTGVGMTREEKEAALAGLGPGGKRRGLGVFIAKALVITQGGTFDIDSEKGHGTSVVITLPAVWEESSNESSVAGR